MSFKRLILGTLILASAISSSAFAQMSQTQALKEVEQQLNLWKSQGRYDDIKIISAHSKSVAKQVKAGKVDLQAIVDTHNYSHKDGKFYGQPLPKRRLVTNPAQRPFEPQDQPVIGNISSNIPAANRPVAAYVRLEKSWQGFPAMLTYSAHLGLTFPNGNFVSCSNWDPAVLSPTQDSVGRAVKDCKVTKQRSDSKKAKKFSKGQRIDIKFGNVSANGFDWGSSSSSQISGSKLLMTKSGRIAIGRFRGTSVNSGGNGVGTSSRARPLIGTYSLDGHIITITASNGEVINGFIAWTSNQGSQKIDHIYLNGEHFWDRSK